MDFRDEIMKIVFKINDVFALVKEFENSPTRALQQITTQAREGTGLIRDRKIAVV